MLRHLGRCCSFCSPGSGQPPDQPAGQPTGQATQPLQADLAPKAPPRQPMQAPPRLAPTHAALEALEAVARWIHPGDGWLPPLVEVPLRMAKVPQLEVLVKPPSVEALWEWYEERGLLDGDPSWAHVWPSAAALSALLAERRELVADKRVAELGAGLGLCGLVSSAVGARTVLLLDREPRALHCAVASAELGKLAVKEVGAACGVQAAVYDWDSPQDFDQAVDVILAAEVLYDPAASRALAEASIRLIRGKADGNERLRTGCSVLVTDPVRERIPGARDAFVGALREAGATVEIGKVKPPNLGEGLEDQDPVVLVEAHWR